MQRRTALAIAIAASSYALPFTVSAQGNDGIPTPLTAVAPEFGPNATDDEGMAILQSIEAKFGSVMRNMYGWTNASFERFYENKNAPLSVLKKALAAPSYEQMLDTLASYQGVARQSAMAKAFRPRQAYDMAATLPNEDANALVSEAKQTAAKVLGDTTKDLVFIPVAPCTVWDTRFATDSNAAGTITNGTTKSFQVYKGGVPANFASFGGNASCAEQNTTTAGGIPYAVMMIAYVNNPSANGWLTFYKYGDPDPSQATISVYYSPGPTRTQTVISKVAASAYDVSATSRFASVDGSASVVGYFMRSPATALDCTDVNVVGTGTGNVAPNTEYDINPAGSCAAGYTAVAVNCTHAGIQPAGLALAQSGGLPGSGWYACAWRNQSAGTLDGADFNAYTRCCRVPGR